jgi:uncharacterized membrane protein
MWTRAELKSRAKDVLRSIYWSAFGVSLVIAIFSGGGGGGGGGRNNRDAYRDYFFGNGFITFAIIMATVTIFVTALLIRILLGYQLEVGGRRYFNESARRMDNSGCFRFAFRGRNYSDILLTMLLKDIQNFLWFLLFIIPGIIKAYAYRMVPFILAENPGIGCKRAIEISNKMTYGHKFDMFILDLSFIGWYLLGVLALGVGVFFVMPYQNATLAELYLVLRQNAVSSGICSAQELSGGMNGR